MKKYILSPICSALVIPGMGQILNSQIKKGVVLLASVFLIFISGTIKLALIISSLLNENEIESPDIEVIVQKLQEMDLSSIWLLIILFSIIWLYSIIDAFIEGRKIEAETKKGPL